ncbi:MAG: hypothetical protein IJA33_01975 [Oscillospiraceae bacterium]|nr:hypothetical protein [Oscillospiraceae bacterium]
MKKRVLSVFLALALVTGLLPGTALATECAHETLECSKDNAQHWTTCVDCGAVVDWESHYDEAGGDGMCDVCAIPINAEGYCVHDEASAWDGETPDYGDHWMTCSFCGGYWEGHYDNTGDDGKCDVCAIPIDEEGYCVHDGEGKWDRETLDYGGHWMTCSICGGYREGHYDENDDGKCDGCDILIDENNQCAHDEEAWNGDQNSTGHHMTCSICGGYWEDHYDENGDGTCDVCGAEITVINIPLQLKAVNAEGEVITDTLDVMLSPAESDNSIWLANTAENYSNVYAVAIGENRLHGWDLYPSGYLKPTEEVTFTVNAKGNVTITSGNATVETTDTMTYIVITLTADTESGGGEGEGGETPPSGSVTILGSAVVGQTLTAQTSGFDPGAELSYQWWKSVEDRVKIEGATESTYTLTEKELHWAIYCVVNGVESDHAGPVEAPAAHSVSVSAVDAADSGVLEGASMQVVDSNGDVWEEWTSTSVPYEVTGLKTGEAYTVLTVVAPSGYLLPAAIDFEIEEDGDLVIGDNVSESGTIQVAFTMTTVSISAVDAENGADLAGATLQVVDSNGDVCDEWTSTSVPHEIIGLKTGEAYTLRADTAPDGYAIPDETSFSIREDGNIVTTGPATMEGVLLVIFERYTITIDDPIGNGTITADKDTAAAGETVTLTITPGAGYVLRSITINGAEDEKVLGKTEVTFTMPAEDVSVSARFQQGIAIYFDNTDSGWTNVLYFEGFGYDQGLGLGNNLYGFIVPGDTPVAFTNYMLGMSSELYPEGYYSTEPFTPESGRTYRSSDFRTIHVATVDDQLTVTATPAGANPAVKMLVIVAGFTSGPTGGQLVDCRTLEAATGSATTPRTVSGDYLELFFVDPVTYAPIFCSVIQ